MGDPEADGHLDDVVVTESVPNGVSEAVSVRERDADDVTDFVLIAESETPVERDADADPEIEILLDGDEVSEKNALNDWEGLLVTVEVVDFTPVRDVVREMDGDEDTDGLVDDEAHPDDDTVAVRVRTDESVLFEETDTVDDTETVRDTVEQPETVLEGALDFETLCEPVLEGVREARPDPV